jgi:hypothetical protein
MLPAQQTFGADHLAHLHLGLIEQLELTGLQTGTHVLLKRTALLQRRLQLGVKEATDIAPLALGLVHGHFSAALHLFTRQFCLAKQAQAHADGDGARNTADLYGLTQSAQPLVGLLLQPGGSRHGIAAKVLDQQYKIIAALTSNRGP